MNRPMMRLTWGATAMLALVCWTAAAEDLALADQPLFVTNNVLPNVVMAIDDSGSMDFEMLFSTNGGTLWWNRFSRRFTSNGELLSPAPDEQGNYWNMVYLFPNGYNANGHKDRRAYSSRYALPPFDRYGFARSPAFNRSYFDPTVDYRPWPGHDDADPDNAQSDPVFGSHDFDLTRDRRRYGNGRNFLVPASMTIPSGTIYSTNGRDWFELNGNASLQDPILLGVQYYPATFYLPADEPLGGEFGYTETPERVSSAVGVDLLKYEIRPSNFAQGSDYSALMQRFANWFTYYRKRHLATRGGVSLAFQNLDSGRVGVCTINDRRNLNMIDISQDRGSFTSQIQGIDFSEALGTPNRQALAHLGSQLANNDDIVQAPCQQNFAVLFTDGYSDAGYSAGVGNADGDDGDPYADGQSNTIADIAMWMYESLAGELRQFERGRVPVPDDCSLADRQPGLDCNRDLHANTFAVTLGQQGTIYGTGSPEDTDPYENPPSWDGLVLDQYGAAQVDDLWHATINSRGTMLNANTPEEVADSFAKALQEIGSRRGSASSLSINTGTISTESRLYQASFTSGSWTGDLVSRPLSDGSGASTCDPDTPTGEVCAAEWSAADYLDANQNWDAGRTIISADASGNGVPFRHASLSDSQREVLSESMVNYLRGSANDEERNGGELRSRNSMLGDIVHSSPVYVGAPDRFRYPLDWDDKLTPGNDATPEDAAALPYRSNSGADFLSTYASRTPMVYVGANDGMLHGFEATSGAATSARERLAFIPPSLHEELPSIADTSFLHKYFVDGNPVVVDALVNTGTADEWRSVLVSNMRGGGKTVFALDVTDPSGFSEANAASTFMWEFGHDDLGYTFAEPQIVRMHNGDWAALVGNGYNNSGSRSASLFVIRLEDGALLNKIDTKAGPNTTQRTLTNGLGGVFPVDVDGDLIVDYAYGADLYGNVWKFDLTADSAAEWSVGFGSTESPRPLFQARDVDGNPQVITTVPQVGAHPLGLDHGVMVYVGTGKYLEPSDASGDPEVKNSFYGVWDVDVISFGGADGTPLFTTELTHDIPRGRLTRQTIQSEVDESGRRFRVLSKNPVDYEAPESTLGTAGDGGDRGWVMDLPQGEGEQISNPANLRGDLVVFSTLIPSSEVCSVGGSGFLMAIDAATGGQAGFAALDVNGDRRFTAQDTVGEGDDYVSGVRINEGAPGRAGFAIAPSIDSDVAIVPVSNATVKQFDIFPGYAPDGRRLWQDIR